MLLISVEDEKENVDDKGKKPMREEDLPQPASAAQDEDADESAGDRPDMELAWENLEVAKYIYEHDTGSTHAQELAGLTSRQLVALCNIIRRHCCCSSASS